MIGAPPIRINLVNLDFYQVNSFYQVTLGFTWLKSRFTWLICTFTWLISGFTRLIWTFTWLNLRIYLVNP